jgi:hypothetical protein
MYLKVCQINGVYFARWSNKLLVVHWSLNAMSAIPSKVDISECGGDVSFAPQADILRCPNSGHQLLSFGCPLWPITGHQNIEQLR